MSTKITFFKKSMEKKFFKNKNLFDILDIFFLTFLKSKIKFNKLILKDNIRKKSQIKVEFHEKEKRGI